MLKQSYVFLLLIVLAIFLMSDGARSATMGWWHLDQGSGTTVADSSGNSNTGTFGGTSNPVWVTEHEPNSSSGYALDFEAGNNSYVSIPNSSSLDLTGGAITIQFWMKPESWTHNNRNLIQDYCIPSTGPRIQTNLHNLPDNHD